MEYKVKDGVNLRACMHDKPKKTNTEPLEAPLLCHLGHVGCYCSSAHQWVSFLIDMLSHWINVLF